MLNTRPVYPAVRYPSHLLPGNQTRRRRTVFLTANPLVLFFGTGIVLVTACWMACWVMAVVGTWLVIRAAATAFWLCQLGAYKLRTRKAAA